MKIYFYVLLNNSYFNLNFVIQKINSKMEDMDAVGNILPQVFKIDAQDSKDEFARMQSFVGAIACCSYNIPPHPR